MTSTPTMMLSQLKVNISFISYQICILARTPPISRVFILKSMPEKRGSGKTKCKLLNFFIMLGSTSTVISDMA